jgi:hypothetical protein
MKGEWPITITNAACLVLSAFILLMTITLAPAQGSDR